MVSETSPWFSGRTQPHHDPRPVCLLEVLEVLKAAEVDNRIRQATETIYQALIEAEFAAVIGASRTSEPRPRPDAERAPAADEHHHGLGTWS